ncbi:MAG: hypothetical protein BWZ09_02766 [Alphaproteobacteria bacterium ADurb.BinA305]|nr:MAG: hypothetical protein BWZ09_02766 [Alphaproteobacteria bacterium ADurb.BinA305]
MHRLRRYLIGEKLPPLEPTRREKIWFVSYGILASIYRVVVTVGIILYIASNLFFLGMAMAAAVAVLWVVTPLVKLAKYIFSVSNGVRCPCVVEPVERHTLRAEWPAFIGEVHAQDGNVVVKGQVLVTLRNEQLDFQIRQLEGKVAGVQARVRRFETSDPATAQAELYALNMLLKDLETLRGRREVEGAEEGRVAAVGHRVHEGRGVDDRHGA